MGDWVKIDILGRIRNIFRPGDNSVFFCITLLKKLKNLVGNI